MLVEVFRRGFPTRRQKVLNAPRRILRASPTAASPSLALQESRWVLKPVLLEAWCCFSVVVWADSGEIQRFTKLLFGFRFLSSGYSRDYC